MSQVLYSLVSSISLIAAAVHINKGLITYTDLAKTLTATNRAEYSLHQCGSLLAAQENISLAGTYLASMDGYQTSKSEAAVDTIHEDLASMISEEDCLSRPLYLHAESPLSTPNDLPNIIYRLGWHDGEFPNG